MSHRSDSISVEKPEKRVRISIDTILEKEYDDALGRPDIQQQIRASIVSIPGDLQIPRLGVSRRRSWLVEKLSLSKFVHLNSN